MSLLTYKLIHIAGILLVFLSLGAVTAFSLSGGVKDENPHRKLFALSHGIGLILVLVSGFGMLARLGMTDGLPVWAMVKLGLWLFFGAALAIVYRQPQLCKAMWGLLPLAGVVAAYLALAKPF